MEINKEELIMFIEVLNDKIKVEKDVHTKIVFERIKHKFECLLKTIETGGLE